MQTKPLEKPSDWRFGSGPVRKPKGWSLDSLSTEMLGRSHRSIDGVNLVKDLENQVRVSLNVPASHKVGFIVGSATAAMEAALWNLIGINAVRIIDFDTFSNRWAMDITKQLTPNVSVTIDKTHFGQCPQLEDNNPNEDLVFCWNGTTTGISVPSLDWVQEDRSGLIFCDATSIAYCAPLPFEKLDITAFSFQKGLGAEAGLGCLILSPKAYQTLQDYSPSWPIPRLLRLKDGDCAVFDAKLLNTPSILTIEECLLCHWLFDSKKAYESVLKNKSTFNELANESLYFYNPIKDEKFQSPSVGILRIKNLQNEEQHQAILSQLAKLLKEEGVAVDILNHTEQPSSLRFWLGPTMPYQDIVKVFPWLHWAYQIAHKSTQQNP